MNVYKKGSTYWLRFRDPQGCERRLRGANSKRAADGIARHIQTLLDFAIAGQAPPEPSILWAMSLDAKRLDRLTGWGVLQPRHTASWQGLSDLIDTWHAGMINRGVGESWADTQKLRASAVASVCGFDRFADVNPEPVMAALDQWRRQGKVPGSHRHSQVSEYTLRGYLKAIKAFSRWMMTTGQSQRDPLAILKAEKRKTPAGAKTSNMAKRRPLTEAEQAGLVSGSAKLPRRSSMDGPERSLLYRTVLQTGIRRSAVYRLISADVRRDGMLNARSGGARNKRTTPKPLRGDTLGMLLDHCQGRAADDPLFDLPHRTGLARMIRADCIDLGIETEGVDFHCLRTTFATTLARRGVLPKTLADLLDDTVEVAMRYYTHSFPQDLQSAVDDLPGFEQAGESERSVG